VKGALIPDAAQKSIVPSYMQMYGEIQGRKIVWERQLDDDKEGLGRYGGLGLRFRPGSADSIKLFVKLPESFRASPEILKLERIQRRLLTQCRDLQVNQLKDFSFDGGGWLRDHIEFSTAGILVDG
jgi:hypothetical protein